MFRSRYLVRGIPPRRFDGHAVIPEIAIRCRSTGSSHRLGFSSRAHLQVPAGVLRGSSYPHEVWRPDSDVGAEVHITRVSTPGSFRLQGFSPS
jgi:hypothetical protein